MKNNDYLIKTTTDQQTLEKYETHPTKKELDNAIKNINSTLAKFEQIEKEIET